MARYVGLDIGKAKTMAAVIEEDGTVVLKELRGVKDLAKVLRDGDMVAAEWTGALAAKWLDAALEITPHVFIYRTQGIRADKRVVGTPHKNDREDAESIAKLLKIQSELGSPRFFRYFELREVFALRRLVYEAEQFTRERVRAMNLFENARVTGYELAKDDEYLKSLKRLERQAWRRAEEAIASHPITAGIYRALRGLYSRGDTVLKIAVQIAPLSRWRSLRALRRYAGLFDQRAVSGQQVKRVTLQGNKHLRTALYQLVSASISPRSRWHALYRRYRERGVKHRQALFKIASYALAEIYRRCKEVEADGEA